MTEKQFRAVKELKKYIKNCSIDVAKSRGTTTYTTEKMLEKEYIAKQLEELIDDQFYENRKNEEKIEEKDQLIDKQLRIINKMAEYIKRPYKIHILKNRKTKTNEIIQHFAKEMEE